MGACLDEATARERATDPAALAHATTCERCAKLIERATQERAESATAISPARKEKRRAKPIDGALSRATLVGRYLILEPLGEGGMGIVYAAYDPDLDRKIALKLVRAGHAGSSDEQQRLLREAQAMAKLSHPNVLPIFDVGTFGERVFLAIEFVDGTTLRRWLRQEPRAWREALAVCVAAGRGLAAAHRAGLVHRDFKPDNVLVGADGRVRVTDFGLARAEHVELPEVPRTRDSLLDASITVAGSIVGTPAYMAPEQREQPADARSDQFAFAVTTYEALHGERPGDASAANTAVPARIRNALSRALAADPAARYPSMDALLDELARESAPARHRWLALVAAVVLGGAGLAAARWLAPDKAGPACRVADARLATAWSPATKTAIHARFDQTGSPYAADAWRATEQALDAYAQQWFAMRSETCEATRVTGVQTEHVMSLRMACLDDRLHELTALVEVLQHADAAVVLKSPVASKALPKLASCADVAGLLAPVPPPADPTAAKEIDELRGQLAKSIALRISGKFDDALAIVHALTPRARKIGYRALEAELMANESKIQSALGHLKEARDTALAAYYAAEAGHHDKAKVRAAAEIISDAGNLGEFELAITFVHVAEAVLERHPDEDLQILLLINTAVMQAAHQDRDACIAAQKQAIAIQTRRDPNDIQLVASRINLAHCLVGNGRHEEAIAPLQSALALLQKAFPTTLHPAAATIYYNLGDVENARGNFEKAIEHYQHVVAIYGPAGAHHPEAIETRMKIGYQYALLGDADRALALIGPELALATEQQSKLSYSLGMTLTAEALLVKGDIERAEPLIRKVIGEDEKTFGDVGDLDWDYVILGDALAGKHDAKGASAAYEHAEQLEAKRTDTVPLRTRVLAGLGQARLALGDPRGVATLERAVAAGAPALLYDRGTARLALAHALSNTDPVRAKELVKAARAELVQTGRRGASRVAEIDAWLAKR